MAQAVFEHLVKQRNLEAYFDRIEVRILLSPENLFLCFSFSLLGQRGPDQADWLHANGPLPYVYGWQSCGTGAYHVGDDPDERTVAKCEEKVSRYYYNTLAKCRTLGSGEALELSFETICTFIASRLQGIPISSKAQAIKDSHYFEFDYLLGMDRNNVRNLESYKPKGATAEGGSLFTSLLYLAIDVPFADNGNTSLTRDSCDCSQIIR